MFTDPNFLIILALIVLCLLGAALLAKPILRAYRHQKEYSDYKSGHDPLDPRD